MKRLYHIILKQYCSISRRINELNLYFSWSTARSLRCQRKLLSRKQREKNAHSVNFTPGKISLLKRNIFDDTDAAWFEACNKQLSASCDAGSAVDRATNTEKLISLELLKTARCISRPRLRLYFCFLIDFAVPRCGNETRWIANLRKKKEKKGKRKEKREKKDEILVQLCMPEPVTCRSIGNRIKTRAPEKRSGKVRNRRYYNTSVYRARD